MASAALRIVPAASSAHNARRWEQKGSGDSVPGSAFLGSSLAPRTPTAICLERNNLSRKPAFVTAAVTTASPGTDLMSSIAGFFKKLIPQAPSPQGDPEDKGDVASQVRRKVAVLGATGKTGKHVVKQLLAKGHSVTALASSMDRAKEVLGTEMGLKVGQGPQGTRGVRVVEGRVQDSEALKEVLRGNDAVICCLGSFSGPKDSESTSPKAVDWECVVSAVNAAAEELDTGATEGEVLPLLDFSSLSPAAPSNGASTNGGALADWIRRDDVIMGGQSESSMTAGEACAVFQGLVRVEGGGFCGANTKFSSPVDASQYDGFRLRVKGDGKRYKVNTRGASQLDGPVQYQASFDTVRGKWVDVFLPFSSFQAMNKGTRVADAGPLDTSSLAGVMFLQSRFQYTGFPNPLSAQGGPFRLEVESISVEKKPRPSFVLLSSAAVERSARAETPEEREASIPIVKLNPSGVLSWKLSGEDAVRASGLMYSVVRPCGLTDKEEDQSFILESAQGDAITGLISRAETAAVCVEALESLYAAGITFEVRRDDLSKGLAMGDRQWQSLFSRLRPDVPAALVQYPAVPQELMEAKKE